MAGAPLRRGGSEGAWVDAVARDGVVVILRLVNLSNGISSELILDADDGAHMIVKDDYVLISYRKDPQNPTVEVSRDDEVIYSCAVPLKNIRLV
jgi:hypothetical protein